MADITEKSAGVRGRCIDVRRVLSVVIGNEEFRDQCIVAAEELAGKRGEEKTDENAPEKVPGKEGISNDPDHHDRQDDRLRL